MNALFLYRQDYSIRQIARVSAAAATRCSKLLWEGKPQPFQAPKRRSKLDPFRDHLGGHVLEQGLSAVGLYRLWSRSSAATSIGL